MELILSLDEFPHTITDHLNSKYEVAVKKRRAELGEYFPS